MKKNERGFMLAALGVATTAIIGLGPFLYTMAHRVNPRVGSATDLTQSAHLETPPGPLAEPFTVKIMTFNVQNLWVVGFNRPARMRAIGDKLAELDPDIVGFQEVFVPKDRDILIQALAGTRLKYLEYFPSATMGSGLLMASAYPIEESFFHRYTASNQWYHVWEGDFWAGKGISVSRIRTPAGAIDVFNTHAQAGYGRQANADARAVQMQEAALFMQEAASGTAPVFAVGDWNCREGAPEYDRLIEEARLLRLMDYRPSIDNIFAVDSPHYHYELIDFEVVHRHQGLRLSDHEGYLATVRITPAEDGAA
jgi:sphingomyelin phosphodiesterase 2